MMKRKIGKTLALLLACGSILGLSQSFADSSNVLEPRVTTAYNFSIGEGSTKTTGSVAKGADNTATNEVLTITKSARESGTLKCWVVDSKGTQVTEPVLYVATGQTHMKYKKTPSGNVSLKIQNPIGGTTTTVKTTGKFHS